MVSPFLLSDIDVNIDSNAVDKKIIPRSESSSSIALPIQVMALINAFFRLELYFTSDKIGVEELKNINFPTRVFPAESLEIDTLAFAKQLGKYQTEFLFTMKAMLRIMNKAYIKSCFDLEDECALFAYGSKKTNKELDEFFEELNKKYP